MQIVGWHNANTGALRAGLSLLNKPVAKGPALSFKYYTLIWPENTKFLNICPTLMK